MEEDPSTIIIAGLIESLWDTTGKGCTAIWRQVAEKFYETIKESGADMSSVESSLDAVRDYFLKHDSLASMSYELKDDEVIVQIDGCSFMSIVDEMDKNNVPEDFSCPFFNVSLVAIEKVTGNMYEWERHRDEPGKCHGHIKKI
jgi:hypothetical protein